MKLEITQFHGGHAGTFLVHKSGLVASMEAGNQSERDRHAAFIVRACNAHDDLVVALESLHAHLLKMWQSDHGNNLYDAIHMTRAALAKAKG